MFKQGKQNTADFIIEFEALAMKANTDKLYAIFLLKKKHTIGHYQDGLRILTYTNAKDLERVEGGNNISRTRI